MTAYDYFNQFLYLDKTTTFLYALSIKNIRKAYIKKRDTRSKRNYLSNSL